MANDFTQWRWSSEHVQTELENGEFLSAESTLVLAGPPSLSDVNLNSQNIGQAVQNIEAIGVSETVLFPIGLLTDVTVGQQRPIQSVFEIGSTRRYLIPEKITSNLRISRVKFFGPSLLRVLYAYYPSKLLGAPGAIESGALPTAIPDLGILPNVVKGRPGYGVDTTDLNKNRDWWINLQSVVFRQPMGLCLYMKASNDKAYGACYLEEGLIGSHTFSLTSDRVMMMEGVSIDFDRVVPIRLMGQLPVGAAA